MPTVLVIANILHQRRDDPYAQLLRAAGFDLRWPALGFRQLAEAELAAELPGADATIAGSEPYTAAILAEFPALRVISRTGVGYDSIDVAAANRCGVAIGLTPGANQDSVAEHALALLLALARNVVPCHLEVAGGGFTRQIPQPLRGRTLGLVGFGRTGRAVAVRARAFGMAVLAVDPFPTPGEPGVEFVPLDRVLAESDYLSLHAPLTPETDRLIRAETIARMKPGVRIVNTARGALIDDADLVAALKSGRIAGAALDVFRAEPPPADHPFRSAPNVVLAPHLAGIDADACAAMALAAARNIVDLHQGRWPADRLANAAALAPWRW